MDVLAVVKLTLTRGPNGGPNIDLACEGGPDLSLLIAMLDSVSANLKSQALSASVRSVVQAGAIDLTTLGRGANGGR